MINKKEFIKKIQEQFMDSEGLAFEESTRFRDIDGWDSLTGMAIQVMIKDDYDIDLTVDKFKSFDTIGDILDFVKTNI
jgi:acyl carrier protein